jgi:hypothetical protein
MSSEIKAETKEIYSHICENSSCRDSFKCQGRRKVNIRDQAVVFCDCVQSIIHVNGKADLVFYCCEGCWDMDSGADLANWEDDELPELEIDDSLDD